MNINLNISQTDIDKVKKVIVDNENAFLHVRQLRNVEKQNIAYMNNMRELNFRNFSAANQR